MRKSVLLFCLAYFGCLQVASSQDTLKTSAHSWTTEVNVNPLQGQFSLNNAVNQIKVRYFISDKMAYRMAFSINNTKKDDGQTSFYGTNPVDNSDVKSTTSGGLNLGLEKHFAGTRRLSPYLGCELALGFKTANETIETKELITDIKGAWQTGSYTFTERGYKSAGVNIVTGFDFYIAKHFFFGYEMLLGLNYIKYDDLVKTLTSKTDQLPGSNTYPDQTSSETTIGPRIINGIRLGYTF